MGKSSLVNYAPGRDFYREGLPDREIFSCSRVPYPTGMNAAKLFAQRDSLTLRICKEVYAHNIL
jgi:hypothetical protein